MGTVPHLLDASASLPVRRGPERRPVVLGTAAAAIFVLRETHSTSRAGWSCSTVVPIALVALELGLRAGIAASGFALALVLFWVLSCDPGLGPLAFATRGVVLPVGRRRRPPLQ